MTGPPVVTVTLNPAIDQTLSIPGCAVQSRFAQDVTRWETRAADVQAVLTGILK